MARRRDERRDAEPKARADRTRSRAAGSAPASHDAPTPDGEARHRVDAPPTETRAPTAAPICDPATVLGRLPTGTTLHTELAAAAYSRGHRSSYGSELGSLRAAIDAIDPVSVDLTEPRRRLAAATGEETRLAERVAAARGELRARRETGAETDAAREALDTAAAALAAAQTTRIAAEQALERARDRASASRDERERRLRLQDRLENRQRAARRELARAVYPAFRDALATLPTGDPGAAGDEPTDYAGSRLVGSVAAFRVATLDGPVVLEPAVADAIRAWSGTSPDRALGVATVRPDA